MYDNIEIVKTYNLNDILSKKYKDKIEIKNKCMYDILKYNSILRPILISISLLPEVTGAIYGGYLVFKGEITSIELITFLVLLDYLLDPIHEFIDLRIIKSNAKASIDRIFEILNSETEIYKDEKIEKLNEDMAIEIKDLNFSYVHNKKVLDKFNLNIKNKKSIGIVGTSGSGKSTIINIICGFYPYESGQVKVFGDEVKDSDLYAIREHISLVTQDTYLYPISIYENLRYGRLDATDEEIIEAAKKANAHDFIMKLPEGYNTILTEGGRNLSGGQKQRLALARAILKNAPILLLDEPTSGLDLDAENIFIDALKNISKEKTIIIIAHRFSTLKIADKIVVLDNGEIIENGSYDELINNEGLFNEMYKKQFTRKEVEMC
jgi:ABC-type multidrug transport system fused ATPase/permease subunit